MDKNKTIKVLSYSGIALSAVAAAQSVHNNNVNVNADSVDEQQVVQNTEEQEAIRAKLLESTQDEAQANADGGVSAYQMSQTDAQTLANATPEIEDNGEFEKEQINGTAFRTAYNPQNININSYIAQRGFGAPTFQTQYKNFPKYAYANGVGRPQGIVIHDTANDNSTIQNEIDFMTRNYKSAFVHAFADGSRVIEIANPNYLSWGSGSAGNSRFVQIELVHAHSVDEFARSVNNQAWYAAKIMKQYGLRPNNAAHDGAGTLWFHSSVTRWLGGTDHGDPDSYFARYGYSTDQFYQLVESWYNKLSGGSGTLVDQDKAAIGQTYGNMQSQEAYTDSGVVDNHATLYRPQNGSRTIKISGNTKWLASTKVDVHDIIVSDKGELLYSVWQNGTYQGYVKKNAFKPNSVKHTGHKVVKTVEGSGWGAMFPGKLVYSLENGSDGIYARGYLSSSSFKSPSVEVRAAVTLENGKVLYKLYQNGKYVANIEAKNYSGSFTPKDASKPETKPDTNQGNNNSDNNQNQGNSNSGNTNNETKPEETRHDKFGMTLDKLNDEQFKFIQSIEDDIIAIAHKNNLYPSIMLGQLVAESDWGRSQLSTDANNFFGVKADAKWSGDIINLPTKEWDGSKYITIDANFRKYATFRDGLQGYADNLRNKPQFYTNVYRENAPTFEDAAKGLNKYATDPNYITSLINRIKTYGFDKLDSIKGPNNDFNNNGNNENTNNGNTNTPENVIPVIQSDVNKEIEIGKNFTLYYLVDDNKFDNGRPSNNRFAGTQKVTKLAKQGNESYYLITVNGQGVAWINAKEAKEVSANNITNKTSVSKWGTVSKNKVVYANSNNTLVSNTNTDKLITYNVHVVNEVTTKDGNKYYEIQQNGKTVGYVKTSDFNVSNPNAIIRTNINKDGYIPKSVTLYYLTNKGFEAWNSNGNFAGNQKLTELAKQNGKEYYLITVAGKGVAWINAQDVQEPIAGNKVISSINDTKWGEVKTTTLYKNNNGLIVSSGSTDDLITHNVKVNKIVKTQDGKSFYEISQNGKIVGYVSINDFSRPADNKITNITSETKWGAVKTATLYKNTNNMMTTNGSTDDLITHNVRVTAKVTTQNGSTYYEISQNGKNVGYISTSSFYKPSASTTIQKPQLAPTQNETSSNGFRKAEGNNHIMEEPVELEDVLATNVQLDKNDWGTIQSDSTIYDTNGEEVGNAEDLINNNVQIEDIIEKDGTTYYQVAQNGKTIGVVKSEEVSKPIPADEEKDDAEEVYMAPEVVEDLATNDNINVMLIDKNGNTYGDNGAKEKIISEKDKIAISDVITLGNERYAKLINADSKDVYGYVNMKDLSEKTINTFKENAKNGKINDKISDKADTDNEQTNIIPKIEASEPKINQTVSQSQSLLKTNEKDKTNQTAIIGLTLIAASSGLALAKCKRKED